jgi:DNA repair protein RadC
MNAHLSLNVTDTGPVLLALESLYSKRVASKLYKECGGSASRILELARIQNGAKWARLQAAQVLHERALLEQAAAGPALEAPAAVRELLTRLLGTLTHEVFCALFLDNRHRLIAMRELFRGTIDGASVHPREVVKEALAHNAAAVVLAHNHPSQVCEPSQADELITSRLREALALVDIRVLDHFVVGGAKCMSFAERGLI